MPTITIRLDDDTREALQQQANSANVTVSDFVRDLIREEVMDLRSSEERGQGLAPDSLSPKDRHVLSLLHRILARVLPEDANGEEGNLEHQLTYARVLEEGFTGEYPAEFAGISTELSKRDTERVLDILDMFRIIDYSIDRLKHTGTAVDEGLVTALSYRGFDFNDSLEHKMAEYVKHLIATDRWTERADFVKGATRGNSHSRLLPMYLRMVAEYRRIMARRGPALGRDDYWLSEEELRAIAAERVHPDNR